MQGKLQDGVLGREFWCDGGSAPAHSLSVAQAATMQHGVQMLSGAPPMMPQQLFLHQDLAHPLAPPPRRPAPYFPNGAGRNASYMVVEVPSNRSTPFEPDICALRRMLPQVGHARGIEANATARLGAPAHRWSEGAHNSDVPSAYLTVEAAPTPRDENKPMCRAQGGEPKSYRVQELSPNGDFVPVAPIAWKPSIPKAECSALSATAPLALTPSMGSSRSAPSLSPPSSSRRLSSANDLRCMAQELKKATQDDLRERVTQLKLTLDHLLTREGADRQDSWDAGLLAIKIADSQRLLVTLEMEGAANLLRSRTSLSSPDRHAPRPSRPRGATGPSATSGPARRRQPVVVCTVDAAGRAESEDSTSKEVPGRVGFRATVRAALSSVLSNVQQSPPAQMADKGCPRTA